jgi:tetratricopeptide (TPR) repeat protein
METGTRAGVYIIILLGAWVFLGLPGTSASDTGKALEESQRLYTEGLIYFRQGEEASRNVPGTGTTSYQKALGLFQSAVGTDPPYYMAEYYLGLTYGKLGQYKDALPHLERALRLLQDMPAPRPGLVRPGHAAIHQDLAVTYYHLEKYEDALQHLREAETILKLWPEAREVDRGLLFYYRGLSHYRLAQYAEALTALEEAKKTGDTLSSATVEFIDKLIEQTQEAQRQSKRWELRIGVGGGFDSNVILQPERGPAFGQITDESDFRVTYSLEGKFDFWRTPSVSLTGSYNFYQTVYTEIRGFDLQAHQFRLTGAWSPGKDLTLGLQGGTNYFRLGDNDYLHEISGMPFLGYFIRPWTYSYLSYRLTNENYLSAVFDPERDGLYHELTARQYFLLGKDRTFERYFFIGYQFSIDNPNLRLGNDFQYHGNQAEVGLELPAFSKTPWETILELSYLFRNEDYTFPNTRSVPPLSRERNDDTHRIFLQLRKPLPSVSPLWNVEVYVSYLATINDSNLDVFEYHRHVGSAGIQIIF